MTDRKSKILVADDDPGIARGIQKTLEKEGYDIITALNGSEALDKIKEVKPGLVLLDINMPGLNGIDILSSIKASDHALPVIMVTAVRDEKEGREALEAGADYYMTKPIDFEYLKIIIFSKMFLS